MTAPPSRRQTAVAAASGLAIGVVLLWFVLSPGSVNSNDAYDYAQMGREIARGNGLTTQQIFPRHIPFLHERGLLDGPWPNLHRYPLPTLLNAIGCLVTEDPRTAAMLQSASMYLLGVSAFAATARRFAPLGISLVLAALFAADPVVLSAASKGLTEGAAMLWVIGLVAFIARPEGLTRTDAALAGVMCGLAWLTRTQLAVMLPIAVVVTVLRGTHWRVAGWCLAGAAVPVAPFVLRSLWLTGDPSFSFSTTRNLALKAAPQDIDMVLDAPVDTSGVWAEHGQAISRKIWTNLDRITSTEKMRTTVAELSAAALAFAGAAAVVATRRYPTLVASTITLSGASFVAISLAFHSSRFYDPLRPLVYLLIAAGTAVVWHALPTRPHWPRRAAAVGWMTLSLWTLWPTVQQGPLYGSGPRPLSADRLASVSQYIQRGSVVMADDSARIALAADLRTIRLPIYPNDLFRIDSDYIRVDAVVLSGRALSASPDRHTMFANYWRWGEAVRSDAFTERWVQVGRVRNNRVYVRKPDPSP